MLEWEGGRKAQDDRIRGLENQKKALIEKNDLMQVLLLISNRRPSRKCTQSEERGGGGVGGLKSKLLQVNFPLAC